ncbi:hypothetical protein [Acidianus sp. HS-5]|uniref:hypothetical protein n=1 Tax=Acidianus sp. HS-5 TaxID=2886040 RepID=UPI001F16F120|nr:hypothetical protein [Acidianus sp. HS-5]BDC18218.1 hypothetical protein HS5_11080 [Acidianus sp. HS-5]
MAKVISVEKRKEGDKTIYRINYESGLSTVIEAEGGFEKGFKVVSISYSQGSIAVAIRAGTREEFNAITALMYLIDDLVVSLGQGLVE